MRRHEVDERLRHLEAEIGGIADVELQHGFARGDHAVGFVEQGTADVIADVIKLVRFLINGHGGTPSENVFQAFNEQAICTL
jgi:hypothetical protein